MRWLQLVLLIGLCGMLVGAGRVQVTIKNMQYIPATVTIKAGDTVVWVNADDRDHTVTAEDKSFRSENINAGGRYERTFPKAGTFRYGCQYHPRHKGVVIVKP